MHFNINGRPVEVEADTRTSLLDLLREHLRLFGTKKGCNQRAGWVSEALPINWRPIPAASGGPPNPSPRAGKTICLAIRQPL